MHTSNGKYPAREILSLVTNHDKNNDNLGLGPILNK